MTQFSSRIARGEPLQEALRAWVASHTKGTLWTQEYTIAPALCDTIYGDGTRLFSLTTINSRPNYYVIRGDSTWTEAFEQRPGVDFGEFTDQIRDDLEAQFGSGRPDDEAKEDRNGRWRHYETGQFLPDPAPWPALDDDMGVSWGSMDWPDHLALSVVDIDPDVQAAFVAMQAGADLEIRLKPDWSGASLALEPEAFEMAIGGQAVSPSTYLGLSSLRLLEPRQRGWTVSVEMTLSALARRVMDLPPAFPIEFVQSPSL